MEGHGTRGHFEVFQQQLLAGNHVIPENLGHEALRIPVFNLEKRPGRLASGRSLLLEPSFCSPVSHTLRSSGKGVRTVVAGASEPACQSQHCLKDASVLRCSTEKNFLGKYARRDHRRALLERRQG